MIRHPCARTRAASKFDDLLVRADSILNDPDARNKVFHETKQTLLEDAPTAFVFHPLNYHMWRPYVVGSDLEPNFAGFRAVVYLNSNLHRTVYINNLIGS
jgi:ABC-type transport system substrate-binding protein